MIDKMGNDDKEKESDSFSSLLDFSEHKPKDKKGQLITKSEMAQYPGWNVITKCLNDEFIKSELPSLFGASEFQARYGKIHLNFMEKPGLNNFVDIFEMVEDEGGGMTTKKVSQYLPDLLGQELSDTENQKKYYLKFNQWSQGDGEMFSADGWEEINEITKSHVMQIQNMKEGEIPFFLKASAFHEAIEAARQISAWICPNCGAAKFKNHESTCECGANHTQSIHPDKLKLAPAKLAQGVKGGNTAETKKNKTNIKIEDIYYFSLMRHLAYNGALSNYMTHNPDSFSWPVKTADIQQYLSKTDLNRETSRERHIKYFINFSFLIHQIKEKNIKLGPCAMLLFNTDRHKYIDKAGVDVFMELLKAFKLDAHLDAKECIDFMASVCKNIESNKEALGITNDGREESSGAVYKDFQNRLAQLTPIYEQELLSKKIAIKKQDKKSIESVSNTSFKV